MMVSGMGRGVFGKLALASLLASVGCSSAELEPQGGAPRTPLTPSAAPSTAPRPTASATFPIPVPSTPPSPAELYLDSAPACTGLSPTAPGLELERGCAGLACVGMTYQEIVAVAGEPAGCDALERFTWCRWPAGLLLGFHDLDEDGEPDPALGAQHLSVEPPFAGLSAEGLGLGVSLRCFEEVYGAPWDSYVEGSYARMAFFEWGRWDFAVSEYSAFGLPLSGRAGSISLFSQGQRLACRTSDTCPKERPKCATVRGSTGHLPTCLPLLGEKMEGEACSNPTNEAGIDDCAPGLRCSSGACYRVCEGLGTCLDGEECLPLRSDSTFGTCRPACEGALIQGACPAGTTCIPRRSFGTDVLACWPAGTAELGSSCAENLCTEGLWCLTDAELGVVCRQPCDAEHPCAAGICEPTELRGAWGLCSR
jgi:hypothetical protein